MTDADFTEIESKLGITLPNEYRELITARAAGLKTLTHKIGDTTYGWFDDLLFLDAQTVIDYNLAERDTSATAYGFPKWWKKFFMLGTDGAGNYFCLRLDGKTGIWMIGTDCGPLKKLYGSLTEFVDKQVLAHARNEEEEKARAAKFVPEEPKPKIKPDVAAEMAKFTVGKTTWKHPKIDEAKLNRQMLKFGTDGSGADPADDDKLRLKLAAWLEKNGDLNWANYIRARTALDGKVPGDDYPDLIEQCLASDAAMEKGKYPDLPGCSPSMNFGDQSKWWDDEDDGREKGITSCVKADRPDEDEDLAAAKLVACLSELIRTTPIRGIRFYKWFREQMATILNAPGARRLTRLSFESEYGEGKPCPAVKALANSRVARNLRRLEIDWALGCDEDAATLAGAPFKRLRRFDVPWMLCSEKGIVQVMTAPWFRRRANASIFR